jgi:exo-1,4-beta-D-glucosaminidase
MNHARRRLGAAVFGRALAVTTLACTLAAGSPAGDARVAGRTGQALPGQPAAGQTAPGKAVPGQGAGARLAPTVVAPGPSATPVRRWAIQSSRAAAGSGAEISRPGYDTGSWFRAGRRSTVMAGLIESGRYDQDTLFFSTNLRDTVDPAQFTVPWWYRTELTVPPARQGERTVLRLGGIIARADVWFNGTKIADSGRVAGAYTGHELDVTSLVRPGRNALAIQAFPGHHDRDLSVWFLDWTPAPPDTSMGVWRDVEVVRSGPVTLGEARVRTELAIGKLRPPGSGDGADRADLTVRAELRNHGAAPVPVTLAGSVTGHGSTLPINRRLTLAPGESRTVSVPLSITDPAVWWPAQWGAQPRYRLTLTATPAAGTVSDGTALDFGIRDVRSELTPAGDRRFRVNGRPFPVRAAGYSSDIFLRWRPDHIESQFRYWRDLGLNAVRMEGKLEHPEFYDLADRYGIMLLPGWECCDKWEGYNRGSHGEPWTDADYAIAGASMAHEARMMRNHPSILGFLVSSDFWPDDRAERVYLEALRGIDWQDPVISSAAMRGRPPQLGSSGMKMEGPYDWVPPNYWYGDRLGAAFGFGSELGAGVGTPEMDSLRRFLSGRDLEQLWREPAAKLYHMSAEWSQFATRQIYSAALAGRYGPPTGLADYVGAAQVADYEAVRAQFEGYAARADDPERPATGMVYWMLNNGWPSLHWHLYDYYLAPGGSYFGAKKANEPLHVQYSYDDRSVIVVNRRGQPARGLTAAAEVYEASGVRRHASEAKVDAPGNGTARALTVPKIDGLSEVYFVKLMLRDAAGTTVSRNVYWLSTEPDLLDWDKSTWYHTPVSRYAALGDLRGLPPAEVNMRTASRRLPGGWGETTVWLRNGAGIAFFNRLSLRRGQGGPEVLPVTWTDNYLTLTPGETLAVTARYRLADLGGAAPTVQLTPRNQ